MDHGFLKPMHGIYTVACKTGFIFTAKEFYCTTFIGYDHVTNVVDAITW